MHGDVPEINVKQLRVHFATNRGQLPHFRWRNLPGRVLHLFEPEPANEMRRWFSDDRDFLEWIPLGFLALLRDHERLNALERSDLPVDVQHLRLEKSRAITGDYRPRC